MTWTVTNQSPNAIGTTNTAEWSDRVFVTTDPTGATGLVNLANGAVDHVGALAVGGSYSRSATVTLPNSISGTYYIVVQTGGPYEFIYGNNDSGVSAPIAVTLSPAPDLIPTALAATTPGSTAQLTTVSAGDTIDVTWTVLNSGGGDTQASTIDSILLRQVGGTSSYGLGAFEFDGPVQAGKSYTRTEQVQVPSQVQGAYQLVLNTNVGFFPIFESNYSNDSLSDPSLLTLTIPPNPDLQVFSVDAAPASANAGGTVSLAYTVINQGTVAATGHWTDNVYISLINKLDSSAILIGTFPNQSALLPGEKYLTQTGNMTVPLRLGGPAYLIVDANANGAVKEFPNAGNNTFFQPINIVPEPPADLVTSGVTAPTQVFDGNTITVTYHVDNFGLEPTDQSNWTDTVWLTRDATRPNVSKGDVLLATVPHTGIIGNDPSIVSPPTGYDVTVTVTLPKHISGQFYITPWSDTFDVVHKSTQDTNVNPDDPTQLNNDNYKARPITVLLTPPPDLQVTSVVATAAAVGGDPFNVQWTVQNKGTSPTEDAILFDQVYLSDTPIFVPPESGAAVGNQWFLGAVEHDGVVSAGGSYTGQATFLLSPDISGKYVIVVTNTGGIVINPNLDPALVAEVGTSIAPTWEGPYTNNNIGTTGTVVTPLPPADLVVTAVSGQPISYSGEATTVQWTVTNQGPTVWSGTRLWKDRVYFSAYPTFDTLTATLVGEIPYSNMVTLAAGASYTASETFTLPKGIGGTAANPQTYYLYVITDFEGDTTAHSRDNSEARSAFAIHGYEDPSNNRGAGAFPVVYREPDLKVTDLVVPATPPHSGDTIPVTWTVSNIGNRDTRSGNWVDRIFLSQDPSLSPDDTELGEVAHADVLKQGDQYTATLNVRLPDGIGGPYYILLFTDATIAGRIDIAGLSGDGNSMGAVPEFQGEGNNITAAALPVIATPPPDLRVTSVAATGPDPTMPDHVLTGQSFTVTFTVSNFGPGDTPDRQSTWDDRVYLSRDQLLTDADVYFTTVTHTGGLAANGSYQVTVTLQAPRGMTGPWYVFVMTDPPTPISARGAVFEGASENNNATSTATPLLIADPPPADLEVGAITLPGAAMSGTPIDLTWTVTDIGGNPASGTWTDTAYLSSDDVWDINDKPIGSFTFSGTLAPGGSYSGTLEAALPPSVPGSYRVIVRTNVFDTVPETDRVNNTTASADLLAVTVPELHLGVPLATTLSSGADRLYQVTVPQGGTLRVDLTSSDGRATNVLFLRYGQLPTSASYDAAYQGALQANQYAVIPSTTAGTYYVLVRGESEPKPATQVSILAQLLPLGITDITPDTGGDSRYVTTTIFGAQFDPQAVVKLVRPGFAEYEPVSYQVVNPTKIIAVFDFRSAPHGLYDVEVINPNGDTALSPYRYLVDPALPADVSIALGGPRVVWAGNAGLYGFTLTNTSNVDLPYVEFQYGVPATPLNEGVPYLGFTTNVTGTPNVAGVPWASVDPSVNTNGQLLTTGYAIDLADQSNTTFSFNIQTYPNGLPPGNQSEQPGVTAFAFNIVGAATPLTRDEFIAQQTQLAATLRTSILADATASQSLKVLATDLTNWTNLYLAALTQAGLLRAVDAPPAVHDNPVLISLQATLAAGVLAGPAGQQIITTGDLMAFFNQVRQWYGNNSSLVTPYSTNKTDSVSPHEPTNYVSFDPAPASDFNLGETASTHYEGNYVYVPWSNSWDYPYTMHGDDQTHPENPNFVNVKAPDVSSFFSGAGRTGNAVIDGPLAYGPQQFVPEGQAEPYTIQFASGSSASSTVSQVRIVSKLDPSFDPRSFRLGDLQVGGLSLHIPGSVGSFQGDFDFTATKGFILRVSAGIDLSSDTATWLLQAIDPLTGEVIQDPTKGLLPPNDASGAGRGFVSYTVAPEAGLATGTVITAQARVLLNNTAPIDTAPITYTLDGQAPVTTLTATPLVKGGADYQVSWTAVDDSSGSGVKGVTVYVSEDGGSYTTWLNQTTATSGLYMGKAGHSYTFLALATDNAGNREQPLIAAQVPTDESGANLGNLPTETTTTATPLGTPSTPTTTPSTNALFVQATLGIPSAAPATARSEFTSVLAPFVGHAFATGIGQSATGIGPLALLVLPDGSVLASGGAARNQLFHFGAGGGAAAAPIATLTQPIYDLALDPGGQIIWAATGGGPLLELDLNGNVLAQFGDSLTQSLAIQPGTGKIYISSGGGIEIFDPATSQFSHFSDIRVGSLAFAPDGTLWAVTWPHDQNQIIAFTGTPATPHVMFQLDTDLDSIAFGQAGTQLAGLLFVTHSEPAATGGELTVIDLATSQQVVLATGGTRGDQIRTSADGRVFIGQSHQIDVLNPIRPPHVISTNPPVGAIIVLPSGSLSVTFDDDMLADSASDPHSVLNPANYSLVGDSSGAIAVTGVTYNPATRTAQLTFQPLNADHYQLQVLPAAENSALLGLAQAYHSDFTATSDLTAILGLRFTNARIDRIDHTVSYDVTVTNNSRHALLLPVTLRLTSLQHFDGAPQGASGRAADGAWLIDLSGDLPANGLLAPGATSTGRTVTVVTTNHQPVTFESSVFGLVSANSAPVFASTPVTTAIAGLPYSYQAVATNADGDPVSYLVAHGPPGLTVDAATGLVTWAPGTTSPQSVSVTLQAYDPAGASATQVFTLQVAGTNQPPVFGALSGQTRAKEGQPLSIQVTASDLERDPLVYSAGNLPPGATFNSATQTLVWTPPEGGAGTYPNVTFYVSDGTHTVAESSTVVVAPTPVPPTLLQPANTTAREGDAITIQLVASDPHRATLTYSSDQLPPGAFLDPSSGKFTWTPNYTQAGPYHVAFTASNGQQSTTQTAAIVVLNANAAPVFTNLGPFNGLEGKLIQFSMQALDPDNPGYVPPTRAADGTLVQSGTTAASVTYVVNGLPPGATFDAQTLLFSWTPGYSDAGLHQFTVTATDDGNGTSVPLSVTATVSITVANVDHAPQITFIPNQPVNAGATALVAVSAADPDGDPLRLTVVGLPSFASFADHGDGTGLITLTPGGDDRGNFTLSVTATDNGDGGGAAAALSATQAFVVTVGNPNLPPHLLAMPPAVAVVGQTLQWVVKATDGDQDGLTFTAVGLPPSATLTPTGAYGQDVITWTPTAADIGKYAILATVTDDGNAGAGQPLSDRQTLSLTVRTSNQAPVWVSPATLTTPEGQLLAAPLRALDPDGDTVSYSAINLPVGAVLNPVTGVLAWTPGFAQVGSYTGIVLTASDGNLAASQTLSITVNPVNEAPIFVPLAMQSGREGTALQFTLTASDPNNDLLSYSVVSGLPAGATLDPQTGHVQWTPGYDQAGDYTIKFAVADPGGLTDTVSVALHIDNTDRPPVIAGLTNHQVAAGSLFTMAVAASDPDTGAVLTWSATGLPAGATLNAQTGAFQWTPGPTQLGDFPLQVTVSDGQLSVTQPVVLRVSLAPVPPSTLIELTPSFPDVPGSPVVVHVAASGFAPITGLTLVIDGHTQVLDSHGRASFTPSAPGHYAISATATDADGLTGTATAVLKVRDVADVLAPVVSFDNPLGSAPLTAAADVTGTVSDTNLDTWTLQLDPFGAGPVTTLASGQASVSGVLYHLDPATLRNGVYQLILTATDIGGRTSTATMIVDADTTAKPAAYAQSTVDLSVSLAGATIDLTRSYSSLDSDLQGSFGYGWHLANVETLLQSSAPLTGQENIGIYAPFQQSTRVYLNLPDGGRVGFTFVPTRYQLDGVTYYRPAYQADPGVTWRLDSANAVLAHGPQGFYDIATARAYNPAAGGFDAAAYTLTEADGAVYHLDGTGAVTDEILPGGARLDVTSAGITSSTGDTVQFVRDASGRITSLIAPDGIRVVYGYDTQGNLISVHDVATATSVRYGYAPDAPHLLTIIDPPPPATGSAVVYGASTAVTPLTADLGDAATFSTTPYAGALAAGVTDQLVFDLRPSELQSTVTGRVYVGILVQAAAGSMLLPAVPELAGMTPLIQRSGAGTAFALYAVARDGLDLIRIAGASASTAGAYTVRVFIAGDINEDGAVNGVDSGLLAQALGSAAGQPNYNADADFNGDGVVDAADALLLAADYGFTAGGPPVITPAPITTHIDLPTTIDLATIATDPEGDPLFFNVAGAHNVTATLAADGHTLSLVPSAGYSGPADFEVSADDGYNRSALTTISVTISSAPLINLDFQQRELRLDIDVPAPTDPSKPLDEDADTLIPGAPVDVPLTILGGFIDQKGVVLPASYLTFVSSNLDVATISATGVLHAFADGSATITVSSHGIQAATPLTVGIPNTTLGQTLYAAGIDPYPEAVTLSSLGGTRQFQVSPKGDITLQTNLTAASTGTIYYVNHPGVVTVTADGLLVAQAAGDAVVTIINGPAEATVPVHVVAPPPTGPVAIGGEGGLAVGSDGSMVAVAPGVLPTGTSVSITPASQSDLPQALPNGFAFAAAFNLGVGPDTLSVPVQLAIKVDPSITPGTRVWFYQAGDYINDDGTTSPIWWQDEDGVVGLDGYARAQSRPFPGITDSSQYLVAYPTVDLGELQLEAAQANLALFNVAIATAGGLGGAVGALAVLSASGITSTLAVPSSPQPQPFRIQILPTDSLPITTTSNVQIDPGQINTYTTTITPPSTTPASAPRITQAKVAINTTGPAQVILTGANFTGPSQALTDIPVTFTIGGAGGLKVTTNPLPGSTATELHVAVPDTVTLGLAQITVTRTDKATVLKGGIAVVVSYPVVSNAAAINSEGTYVFVALPEFKYQPGGVEGALAVLNGDPVSGHFGDLIANIPLGYTDPDTPGNAFPRDVAVTPDNTRAYVTLRGTGRIAVVDTVTLQELDVTATLTPFVSPPGKINVTGGGVLVDPALFDQNLTSPTVIRGTINVPNIASWMLQLVPTSGSPPTVLKIGNGNVDSGVLTTLDTGIYPTGFYQLVLTAVDMSGKQYQDNQQFVYLDDSPRNKDIRLPFGAQPYGIAIDPAGKYAYVAAQSPYLIEGVASSYLFQIDIEPSSKTYNQVVQRIAIGSLALAGVDAASQQQFAASSIAPSGLRNVAVSNDGLKIYVTAPNDNPNPAGPFAFSDLPGNLITVDITRQQTNPKAKPAITSIPGGAGTYGVATTPGRADAAFTNAQQDGVGVIVTNQAAGTKQTIPLNLDQAATASNPLLSVHNAGGIVFTPDGKYAFIAGRADQVTSAFGGGFNGVGLNAGGNSGYLDQTANPLYEDGDVGIIADPLGPHPTLVAATRPVPYGFPVDLALSPDGHYLYVSYQGLPTQSGSGGVMIFDANAIIQVIKTQPAGLLTKVAVDDLPLVGGVRTPNAKIDVRADYRLHTDTLPDGSTVQSYGIPAGSNNPPVLTGGFPGGIAVQTKGFPILVQDASGDDSPDTVFQHGVLSISYGLPSSGLGGVVAGIQLIAVSVDGGTPYVLKSFLATQLTVDNSLLNLDTLPSGPAGATPSLPPQGRYALYLSLTFTNGQAPARVTAGSLQVLQDVAVAGAPNVRPDGTIHGDLTGTFFVRDDYTELGVVIYGGGGTDVLDIGLAKADVLSIDGITASGGRSAVDVFTSSAGIAPQQAFYKGTAFDYIRLDTGQEIYFQGIARLLFTDGFKELQIDPNDPSFPNEWGLAVTGVPDAWRFTTGSNNVLLVSLDNGLPSLPTGSLTSAPRGDDLTTSSRINASDLGAVSNTGANNHGHSSVSILSSLQGNSLGVAGINWTSPVRVENVYASSTAPSDLLKGIQNAVNAAAPGQHIVFQGGIQGEVWRVLGVNAGAVTAADATLPALSTLITSLGDTALFAVAAGNGNDPGIMDPNYLNSVSGVAQLQTTNSNVIAVGALSHVAAMGTARVPALIGGVLSATVFDDNAQSVFLASYSNRGSNLTLVAPTDDPAALSGNDIQTIILPGAPTSGGFTLTFNGVTTSKISLSKDAKGAAFVAPATIQTALEELAPIGAGNVYVSGGGLNWSVMFVGALAAAPQPLLIGDGSALIGGTPSGPASSIPFAANTVYVRDDYRPVNPTFGGTSAANPVLAGISSLVWSLDPALTAGQLRQLLIDTAVPLTLNAAAPVPTNTSVPAVAAGITPGSMQNTNFGYGLVNAEQAVRRAYALVTAPAIANLFLSNGLLNPAAVAETGSVIASTAAAATITPLTVSAMQRVAATADAALTQWSAGLHVVAPIKISVKLANLPIGELAEAQIDAVDAAGTPTAGTILLDPTANGVGWFIDATPGDASEFSVQTAPNSLTATAGSPAAGKYDLLTVLLHEEGHLLGIDPQIPNFATDVGTVAGSQVFTAHGVTAALTSDGEHLSAAAYPNDLMADTLSPSERRLPSVIDLSIVEAVRGAAGASVATGGAGVTTAVFAAAVPAAPAATAALAPTLPMSSVAQATPPADAVLATATVSPAATAALSPPATAALSPAASVPNRIGVGMRDAARMPPKASAVAGAANPSVAGSRTAAVPVFDLSRRPKDEVIHLQPYEAADYDDEAAPAPASQLQWQQDFVMNLGQRRQTQASGFRLHINSDGL